MPGVELHVAADDRTGALECAAALADRLGAAVPVTVWPDAAPPAAKVSVVDLASRHLRPEDAAARAAALPATGRRAHKIDSTLRGNWAVELVARHRATGDPVLVVPAFPALGRVCSEGVVLVDGVPVHETAVRLDPHGGPASSRPAEHVAAAGVPALELHDPQSLSAWFAAPSGIAVADATGDEAVTAVVDRWHARDGIVLAGTSAVIGAAIGEPTHHAPVSTVRPPTLVVCGSLHPVARRQIEHAREAGVLVVERFGPEALRAMLTGTPVVLRTPDRTTAHDGGGDDGADDDALRDLVREASAVIETGHLGTLVLIGGDTAAAVLGETLVAVLGTVGPGTAVLESLVVDVPVVTRAGSFGGDDALVRLLHGARG